MFNARTMTAECCQVLGRSISFVTAESVIRIQFIQGNHVTVPTHFRQNGCGSDTQAQTVATDNRLLRRVDVDEFKRAVHHDGVNSDGQVYNRGRHRLACRRQDALLIYIIGRTGAYGISRYVFANECEQALTSGRREKLGVPYILKSFKGYVVKGEYNGRGEDWASQRATSRFINAGHAYHAMFNRKCSLE